MSDAYRVALVAEGKTDREVIEAALTSFLVDRSFILTLLQPEDPLGTPVFGTQRPGGWGGVYRWCREAVVRSDRLSNDVSLSTYNLLIIQVDADVAESTYASAHINDALDPTDLPCVEPCPPPQTTINRLAQVLLKWINEPTPPDTVLFCIPSKAIEAWVVTALYPSESVVVDRRVECYSPIANVLQSKPAIERLITSGKKDPQRYKEKSGQITTSWQSVRRICTEADRFSCAVLANVSTYDTKIAAHSKS